MAGFLPSESKADLLQKIHDQGLYIGLATSIDDTVGPNLTLAGITEVAASGYGRAGVTWNNPSIDATSGLASMVSATDADFPVVNEDMTPASYAFCTDSSAGTVLPAPAITTPLATPTATGGTFAAGTYFWVITATNAHGETVVSNEVSATLTANEEQALSWGAVSGATGYNVYRGTSAGGENVLVASVSGTTYTDTGAAGTAQTPPAASTASTGTLWYVWTLAEPVATLAGKPTKAPAGGLIIE